MRKISRAEEQFTSLNFRTANGNRDWVEKNHADVMKNGFDCDVCGKKFPPGTDFDDIEENGGANKEAGRSCSPECTEELAERERDAEDGAATANAEWNYSRRAAVEPWNQKDNFRVVDSDTPLTEGGPKCEGCGGKLQDYTGGSICRNRACDKYESGYQARSTRDMLFNVKPKDNVGPTGPATGHDGLLLNPEECTNPVHREGFNNSDEYCNECGDNHIIIAKSHDGKKKEAGAAEIVQTIVNHLPVAVPAAVAGGAAITKVVDKIIKKKKAPPATGTEEAYNSTGFMSPQQVQERREASFDERYANEKTANQYIEKQGDSWVITQKSTGKVLSHHDSKEKAEASFRAMMQSKHGSVIAAKKCKCGHEEGAHMWDTKMDPQAESQMEDLGCRECGSWTRDGDFETDCKEFDADKDFRGQHSNLNSDW